MYNVLKEWNLSVQPQRGWLLKTTRSSTSWACSAGCIPPNSKYSPPQRELCSIDMVLTYCSTFPKIFYITTVSLALSWSKGKEKVEVTARRGRKARGGLSGRSGRNSCGMFNITPYAGRSRWDEGRILCHLWKWQTLGWKGITRALKNITTLHSDFIVHYISKSVYLYRYRENIVILVKGVNQ